MQIMSWPRWFRIVSTRIAVLPVERSPMISSRWPRPTFVIESIALIPDCSGSFTRWRATTQGALNSRGRASPVSIGPSAAVGVPSGSTVRPINASPTGTLATRPVRRTGSPSLTCSQSPKSAAPTLSSSRLNARPVTPCSNSSISLEAAFSSPYTRAMPSPTWSTVPTSASSVSTSYCSIRLRRIAEISSGRSCTVFLSLVAKDVRCQFLAQALDPAADAGVDAHRAGLQDEAADQVGIDPAGRLDLASRRLSNQQDDRLALLGRQLDRSRELDVQDALVTAPHVLELALHDGDLVLAPLLGDEQQEVAEEVVRPLQEVPEHGGFRPRVELRVPQPGAEPGHAPQPLHEAGDLVADPLQLPRLLGRVEQGRRVYALRDRH